MSIYVGNLPYKVGQEELKEIFTEYGTVANVHIPSDRETGRSRGFGFVEMENEGDEQKAIDALDGAEWMTRELRVNKAKPRQGTDSRDRGRRDFGNSKGSFRSGGVSQHY
ncbi:MAG TPA: RNA-binding protein [Oscillatoriales cyanobacterium M59_W2019_021]|nr:RNA-binding protein [Oscillatoriales cyanobacterium M4454_W2019_049]HIK50261.1 RNA-binding protein [Oscillatoriales cyanobacterium M59_W2019_021]